MAAGATRASGFGGFPASSRRTPGRRPITPAAGSNPSPSSALVAHDIDDDAMGVSDKESPNAPWLVGQGIRDRIPLPLSRGMASIDVGYFDTDIRVRFSSCIRRHDANLGRRVGRRGEGDDPPHVHGGFEPE